MTEHQFERIGELSTTTAFHTDRRGPSEQMTVAIAGIPRGGTTMIAAVVDALGINLGPQEDLDNFHFEDQTMHSPYLDVQYRYLAQRNEAHQVWGWKDPTSIEVVSRILFALRNPHVIVVFRDMLATIQGEMRFDVANEIAPARTFADLATQTLQWWTANMGFIARTQFPTLLVSFERAMLHPAMFIQETADFLGITPTDEQRAEALSRISIEGGYIT